MNGNTLKKECSEFEISNEINFMRKLFETKNRSDLDNKKEKLTGATLNSLSNNVKSIEVNK
jgi:hypothetical protein